MLTLNQNCLNSKGERNKIRWSLFSRTTLKIGKNNARKPKICHRIIDAAAKRLYAHSDSLAVCSCLAIGMDRWHFLLMIAMVEKKDATFLTGSQNKTLLSQIVLAAVCRGGSHAVSEDGKFVRKLYGRMRGGKRKLCENCAVNFYRQKTAKISSRRGKNQITVTIIWYCKKRKEIQFFIGK